MTEHTTIACKAEGCERHFISDVAMLDHAAAVHSFDDIRRLVSDALRDKYNRRGNYNVTPPIQSVYTWVVDLADDWAVFEYEGSGSDYWKSSYSIVDGIVTLGEPVQVARRTVYEPVPVPAGETPKKLEANS